MGSFRCLRAAAFSFIGTLLLAACQTGNEPQGVRIQTPYGTMQVELYDSTPKHKANFLRLAENDYYNGLLFHRVIEGFMIQGGDPDSRSAPAGVVLGAGGPDSLLDAEIGQLHLRGAVAAARTGDQVNPSRKSSGSQFYIVQGSPVTEDYLNRVERQNGIRYTPEQRAAYLQQGGTPQLDGSYTVFGRVVSGREVIDKIASLPTDSYDRPLQDVAMRVSVY